MLIDGQVTDSHPVGGERADLYLRWEAPEAPPSQRYIVQVSEDRGVTWQTVAVGLPEPAITLQPSDFAGDQVEVRVLATTGSGTTVVRIETVSIR